MEYQELQEKVRKLETDLRDLTAEVYRNNFSGSQDFNKKVSFTTSVVIPKYASLPSSCEQNEVVGVDGKLYICSSQNTWTLVGSQS